MNIQTLPFNERDILIGVRPWVACESPSSDGAAVSRMVAHAAHELQQDGAQVRAIQGKGDCVFADFDPFNLAPGILILGHLDTVHPTGAIDNEIRWREENGRCYGPGLFDMKSGNYIALEALQKVRAAGFFGLPVRFLFASDEESGSASNRNLKPWHGHRNMCLTKRQHCFGSVPLPGVLKSGPMEGPSHALLQKEGRASTLSAMAKIVLTIEEMNSQEYSLTVTNMNAGRAVSTVPLEAYAEVICTARSQQALEKANAFSLDAQRRGQSSLGTGACHRQRYRL